MVQSPSAPILENLNPEWDLSNLYRDLEDPKLNSDLEQLKAEALAFREQFRGKVTNLDAAQVATCLAQLEDLSTRSGLLYAFPSLIFAADTRNTLAKQVQDRVLEALTEVENQLLFFELELQDLPEAQFARLQADPSLKNYQHYLNRSAVFRPHKLSEEVEQSRNQANLTGRQAFIKLREVHLGQQEYEPVETPEGKCSTEAELGALSFQPNRELRYQAYQSIRKVIKTHNPLYGYILNTVSQDHRIESQQRAYPSTLHKQLLADEAPEAVFRAVMEGTHARQDLFRRYYQLKGKTLGQPIRTCDLYAPWATESVKPIEYDSGVNTLLAALTQFSPDYARRAEEFFIQNWVDAKVRPGKRGGAFCWPVYGKNSFLLLSYTSDYNSLFTLAHEMGHGLHFTEIGQQQSYFNSNPPMVLAEIASTFNELLLLDYLLKKAEAEGDTALTRTLLTRQLEDQLNLLFRQSTISRLELAVHEQAQQGSFDHSFVNEQWQSLYTELCGEAVEVLPEHQYDWARIGHIYFKPFYCWQYTASNIVSLACYQQYLRTGQDFISGYLGLLGAGSAMDQVEALKHYVDVDITDAATVTDAIGYVEGLINKLETAFNI
ncbi:M3 family oligoendopeptidase [Leptolyngbya sp. FACHB-261]|uniref:M3 family oligoendopeptidase n=1 Tax=Leptolyngbya sp. FACHB-261 TaxID=2692806 RepID=UPI001685374A|nr:M3 family metallopeptidase [Leptolyngbya sp. FACHB-261]MBD2102617.1 oligoendopeptidase F [Leptolyngbya sp. FACHB-261]